MHKLLLGNKNNFSTLLKPSFITFDFARKYEFIYYFVYKNTALSYLQGNFMTPTT